MKNSEVKEKTMTTEQMKDFRNKLEDRLIKARVHFSRDVVAPKATYKDVVNILIKEKTEKHPIRAKKALENLLWFIPFHSSHAVKVYKTVYAEMQEKIQREEARPPAILIKKGTRREIAC